MRVKWCKECGRLGAFTFAFCPWCGHEFNDRESAATLVELSLGRLEDGLANGDRMQAMARSLDKLDRDLSDFIAEGQGDGLLVAGQPSQEGPAN